MNGYLLHEYVMQHEAPLRAREARIAAQRHEALASSRRPFGFRARHAIGEFLVGFGASVQGQRPPSMDDCADATA